MGNITITAVLKAVKGKEDELKEILLDVIKPSRDEEGCIEYVLHESVEDPGVFVFYESWRDEAALTMHISSAHYQNYRKNSERLIQSRKVYRLKETNHERE